MADETMTLRESIELAGIDEDPGTCAFTIAMWCRSAEQGEPATFEGECQTLIEARRKYDIMTPYGIRQWMEDLEWILDKPMPVNFVRSILDADKKDYPDDYE